MLTLWLCQNSYWKYPIYSWFTHEKWWFSIVMLVYPRSILDGYKLILTSLMGISTFTSKEFVIFAGYLRFAMIYCTLYHNFGPWHTSDIERMDHCGYTKNRSHPTSKAFCLALFDLAGWHSLCVLVITSSYLDTQTNKHTQISAVMDIY